MSTSIFIYACVAATFNGLMGLYASNSEKDENITGWLGLGIPGIACFFCGYILLVSPGVTILNYILCLGSMLYFGYRGWDRMLNTFVNFLLAYVSIMDCYRCNNDSSCVGNYSSIAKDEGLGI